MLYVFVLILQVTFYMEIDYFKKKNKDIKNLQNRIKFKNIYETQFLFNKNLATVRIY